MKIKFFVLCAALAAIFLFCSCTSPDQTKIPVAESPAASASTSSGTAAPVVEPSSLPPEPKIEEFSDAPMSLFMVNEMHDGKYTGQIIDGVPNGQGTFIIPEWTVVIKNVTYQGQFKDGKPNGKGTLYNGSIDKGKSFYSGDWIDGYAHGVGTECDINGNVIYVGQFEYGLYEGSGTQYNPDGSVVCSGLFATGAYITEWESSGVYLVGSDIEAGEYVIKANASGAYMEVCSDSSGRFESIITNENVIGTYYINLANGQYLKISNGSFVSSDDYAFEKDNLVYDGMYKVGKDIASGEYLITPQDGGGYIAVYINCDAISGVDNILTNEILVASTYQTVEDGQYLYLVNCSAKLK